MPDEKAQNYTDLFKGEYCTNCHHLISDHFQFTCVDEAICHFAESVDNMYYKCICKRVSRNFKLVFNPEDFVVEEKHAA